MRMMRAGIWMALALAGPAAAAGIEQPVAVPSGQPVTFVELVRDAPGSGLTYRFRFIAPSIAGAVDFDTAMGDMDFLCESFALPRLAATGPLPAQVVISLSDRPVAFGDTAPEAVQFFEAYRPDGETCVWEAF